jgi:hypothetical protein
VTTFKDVKQNCKIDEKRRANNMTKGSKKSEAKLKLDETW